MLQVSLCHLGQEGEMLFSAFLFIPFAAVAIQCLETAFGVSMDDRGLAVSQTLPRIFEAAVAHVGRLVGVSW